MDIQTNLHVINSDRMIYKVSSVRELDARVYSLVYSLDLVAGYDYVNPDESDRQGFVSKENFVENVQWECLTVYPLNESLGDRLEEEGYKIIDIEQIQIHQFRME